MTNSPVRQYVLQRTPVYLNKVREKTSRADLNKLIQEKYDYMSTNEELTNRLKSRLALTKKNLKTPATVDRGQARKPLMLNLNVDDRNSLNELALFYGIPASEILRTLIRVTSLQLPTLPELVNRENLHPAELERFKEQRIGINDAGGARHVPPEFLYAPTDALIALTRGDYELDHYRFFTRTPEGRMLNLEVAAEVTALPEDQREDFLRDQIKPYAVFTEVDRLTKADPSYVEVTSPTYKRLAIQDRSNPNSAHTTQQDIDFL